METIIAAMVGLVGVFLAIGAAWIRAGFEKMDEKFDARFDKLDERFDKVDERFDRVDAVLRLHGERIARIEGALGASGILAPSPLAAHGEPAVGTPAAEAATG